MAYLIDTNVISELRKKDLCDANVTAWQSDAAPQEVFISTISLMEIHFAILSAKRKNAEFAGVLQQWYETQVKPTFDGRVLPINVAVSEQCSVLLNKRSRGLADALIAATAYVNDLILVTRNTSDFSDCGVKLVNPWTDSPTTGS